MKDQANKSDKIYPLKVKSAMSSVYHVNKSTIEGPQKNDCILKKSYRQTFHHRELCWNYFFCEEWITLLETLKDEDGIN